MVRRYYGIAILPAGAVLAPAARGDLLAAVRWISKDNPAAARGLRDGVVRAAERIGEHVHIGARRASLLWRPSSGRGRKERFCLGDAGN